MSENDPYYHITEANEFIKNILINENLIDKVLVIDKKNDINPNDPIEIPIELKKEIAKQEAGKEYVYALLYTRETQEAKIIFSNKKQHIAVSAENFRFVYLDEKFNQIYKVSNYIQEVEIESRYFKKEAFMPFEIKFYNKYYKDISIFNDPKEKDVITMYAKAKDKIRKIKFNDKKNIIKAEIVNSFIKNIIFNAKGEICSVGIRNKISKELNLSKVQFDVNTYQQLFENVKQELEMYDLISDGGEHVLLSEDKFNEQVRLIRYIIKNKDLFKDNDINKHCNYIKDYIKEIKIQGKKFTTNEANLNLNYPKGIYERNVYQIALFLRYMKNDNLNMGLFIGSDIMNSLNYLENISLKFKEGYELNKNHIENKNGF